MLRAKNDEQILQVVRLKGEKFVNTLKSMKPLKTGKIGQKVI